MDQAFDKYQKYHGPRTITAFFCLFDVYLHLSSFQKTAMTRKNYSEMFQKPPTKTPIPLSKTTSGNILLTKTSAAT